jgi:uncharacterized protein (TIRG00374 family)
MIWLKRGISLILLGVLIFFFWPLIGEFGAVGDLIRKADWIWFGAAVVIQVISYAFLTWLNALSLQPFSGRIGFGQLAFLLTAMAFIEIAIPSAGASGIALRVRLLRKFGYSPEASLFSLIVETLSELVALVTVAFLGVFYLLRSGRFRWNDILWFSTAGGVLLLATGFAWRVLMDPQRSQRVVFKLAGWWNRLLGRYRRVEQGQLEERLRIFRENLGQYQRVPVWKFILAAYGKVLLDVATLGAGFYLFRFAISPGTLLTGYGLILTFSGLAALPGGLGMADAYVPVLFSWLAVPGSVALAAGLTYRLIAFWLVRFVGFISWNYLEARSSITPQRH